MQLADHCNMLHVGLSPAPAMLRVRECQAGLCCSCQDVGMVLCRRRGHPARQMTQTQSESCCHTPFNRQFTGPTRTLHSFLGCVCMLKTTACKPDLCMTNCLHHCRHVLYASSSADAAKGGGALWGPVSVSADGTAGSGNAAQHDRHGGALWGAPIMAESATEYDAAMGGVEAGVGDDTVWQPTTADAGAGDASMAMNVDDTSGHGSALWGQRGGSDAAAGEDAPAEGAGQGGALWGDGYSAVDAATSDEAPADGAGQGWALWGSECGAVDAAAGDGAPAEGDGQGGALWGEYGNMTSAAGDELQAGEFAGQDDSIEAGYPLAEAEEEAGDGPAVDAQADDAGIFWGMADGGGNATGSDAAAAGGDMGEAAYGDDAAGFTSQAAAEGDTMEQDTAEPSADCDMPGCNASEYADVGADEAAADDLQPAATDMTEHAAGSQYAALDASTAAAAAAAGGSDGYDWDPATLGPSSAAEDRTLESEDALPVGGSEAAASEWSVATGFDGAPYWGTS